MSLQESSEEVSSFSILNIVTHIIFIFSSRLVHISIKYRKITKHIFKKKDVMDPEIDG
jgi:hypothetical protein